MISVIRNIYNVTVLVVILFRSKLERLASRSYCSTSFRAVLLRRHCKMHMHSWIMFWFQVTFFRRILYCLHPYLLTNKIALDFNNVLDTTTWLRWAHKWWHRCRGDLCRDGAHNYRPAAHKSSDHSVGRLTSFSVVFNVDISCWISYNTASVGLHFRQWITEGNVLNAFWEFWC